MKTLARLFRRAADRLDPPMEGITVPRGWIGALNTSNQMATCPACLNSFVGSHSCPGHVTYSGPLSYQFPTAN